MEAASMGKQPSKPRRVVLRLRDLDHSKAAVLNSLGSPASRRAYEFAIDEFIAWYCSEPRLAFGRIVVARFRMSLEARGLSSSSINQRLAAVRRLAYEAADCGLLSPELAAGIRRVKGVKQLGRRSGNWLTLEQCSAMLNGVTGEDLRARRDHAMISVLIGCGLRRSELAALDLEHLQTRQGHWAIVDLVGKGGHIRTVPMPLWVKDALDGWTSAAGIAKGRVFRAISRAGKAWGTGISENVVWHVVSKRCTKGGLEHIAPHDLRRTCARLCHSAGGELEQIPFLLGHSSVQTTERYLGCKQNLGHPVNDRFAPAVTSIAPDQRHDSDLERPLELPLMNPVPADRRSSSEAKDLVVFDILRDSKCADCGQELSNGEFLFMEGGRPLCLACADLGHLVYLPRGDTALTRRARKHSALSAVVVRFSRSRGRYERQGVLVEESALERAEEECYEDAAERRARRERDEMRRAQQDHDIAARMTESIHQLFPGCPPEEARAIATHTSARGSGRVGRTSAGRALEEEAMTAAVIAAIRHKHTDYDRLLMDGISRIEAREAVRDQIDRLLDQYRAPCG
jgi:site-specific recombinase XerC